MPQTQQAIITAKNGDKYQVDITINASKHPDPNSSTLLLEPEIKLTPLNKKQTAIPHLVFILDKSGSMNGTPINTLKEATTQAIKKVTNAQTTLISFDEKAELLVKRSDNTQESLSKVEQIMADGPGTNIASGLLILKELNDEKDLGTITVFLLTDGQDNNKQDYPDVFKQLNATFKGDLKIIPIGLGSSYDAKTLGIIAEQTKTPLIHIENPDAINIAFGEIEQYIGYGFATTLTIQTKQENQAPRAMGYISQLAKAVTECAFDDPMTAITFQLNDQTIKMDVKPIDNNKLELDPAMCCRYINKQMQAINNTQLDSKIKKQQFEQMLGYIKNLPAEHEDVKLSKILLESYINAIDQPHSQSANVTTSILTTMNSNTTVLRTRIQNQNIQKLQHGNQGGQPGSNPSQQSFPSSSGQKHLSTSSLTNTGSVYSIVNNRGAQIKFQYVDRTIDFANPALPNILISMDATITSRLPIIVDFEKLSKYADKSNKLYPDIKSFVENKSQSSLFSFLWPTHKILQAIASNVITHFSQSKKDDALDQLEQKFLSAFGRNSFAEIIPKVTAIDLFGLDYHITQKDGLCTDRALFIAYLIGDQVKQKKLAAGSVHLFRGTAWNLKGHAWTIYETADKKQLFLIDSTLSPTSVFDLRNSTEAANAITAYKIQGLEGVLAELFAYYKIAGHPAMTCISDEALALIPEEVNQKFIAEDDICPISQEVMKEPVKASDGHWYDKAYIDQWIQTEKNKYPGKKPTSPLTRKVITETLIPAHHAFKDHVCVSLLFGGTNQIPKNEKMDTIYLTLTQGKLRAHWYEGENGNKQCTKLLDYTKFKRLWETQFPSEKLEFPSQQDQLIEKNKNNGPDETKFVAHVAALCGNPLKKIWTVLQTEATQPELHCPNLHKPKLAKIKSKSTQEIKESVEKRMTEIEKSPISEKKQNEIYLNTHVEEQVTIKLTQKLEPKIVVKPQTQTLNLQSQPTKLTTQVRPSQMSMFKPVTTKPAEYKLVWEISEINEKQESISTGFKAMDTLKEAFSVLEEQQKNTKKTFRINAVEIHKQNPQQRTIIGYFTEEQSFKGVNPTIEEASEKALNQQLTEFMMAKFQMNAKK